MIIDGRTIANHILAGLLARVDILQEKYGIQPHMAVIRVGDDPAITSYIAQKEKKAKEIGAVVSVYNFPENVTQEKLKECIDFLQKKGNIHGLILQLPVPKTIDYEALILDIHPDKDIDGFRPNSKYVIPVASAVLKILELVYAKELEKSARTNASTFNEWLSSKKIVVMGKGKTGGWPVIHVLQTKGVKVDVIDSSTVNRERITSNADIIISAVGKPHTLTTDMIKKDAILIGIGMSMNSEGLPAGRQGKFVGDYDEEKIQDKVSWYTPTPGGVGPVNVACLMENLILSAESSA